MRKSLPQDGAPSADFIERVLQCAAVDGIERGAFDDWIEERDLHHLVGGELRDQMSALLQAGVSEYEVADHLWPGRPLEVVEGRLLDFDEQWEDAGFEVTSTGGGCWAARKKDERYSWLISLTDQHESRNPNPSRKLYVSVYGADSGEYLGLQATAENLTAALAQIQAWQESLLIQPAEPSHP